MSIGERIKNMIGIEGSVKDTILPMAAYNALNISDAGADQLRTLYYQTFLTYVEGLSPGRTGLVLLFRSIWDAMIDPFLGLMSDRTRSRWGKHRIYFLIGAVPFGLTCFLLWNSFGISGTGNAGNVMLYYVIVNMLFTGANSFLVVPHQAMLPELAPGYFQRTQYISMGWIFNSLGQGPTFMLAAALLGLMETQQFTPALRPTFMRMGLILGIVFIFPILITALGTKEKSSKDLQLPPMDAKFFVNEYRSVFKSRAYVQFIKMSFLEFFAAAMFLNTSQYFILETAGAGQHFNMIMMLRGLAEMTAFPLNYGLTKRVGKEKMAWFTSPFLALSLLLTFTIGRQGTGTIPFMLIALFAQEMMFPFGRSGIGFAVDNFRPDVTDVDEMIFGRRREGVMAAINSFIRLASRGFLQFIIGIILEFFGIQGGAAGYENEPMFRARAANIVGPVLGGPNAGMRLVRGVLPMIFVGCAMLALRRFRMTKEDLVRIQELIREKHETGNASAAPEEIARMEEITGQKWEDMWIGQVNKAEDIICLTNSAD